MASRVRRSKNGIEVEGTIALGSRDIPVKAFNPFLCVLKNNSSQLEFRREDYTYVRLDCR